jgi:CRP-like cAMP-binding protein
MYILSTGTVRIYKSAGDNLESEIATIQEGDFFGEMALLDSDSRSANATALTDCELFTLDQFAFMSLILKSRVQVVFRVFSALVARIRESNERSLEKELEIRSLGDKMEIERLRSLSQMVAGVAHEINTPLGTINTAASIIQNTLNLDDLNTATLEDKTKKALKTSREALDLMQRNIQRAHKLTRMGHTMMAVAFVDVVMETDTAGLELCEYLRGAFDNKVMQVYVRTGQPGIAPEAQCY